MRHRVKGRKLSRTASHRKATMRALTMALVKEHRITTTVAKAKELRRFVEPLITRAKEDNLLNRRMVFSSLQNKETVKKLFSEVGPKSADRNGGYTRVIKLGFRQGDGAEMALIELVDFNDVKPEGKTTKKKRTRRAGKSNTPTSSEATSPKAEETTSEEEEDSAKSAE
ncbi:MAG: 50S ribosomal protein L17 [bacterium]|jgi:large subunit ribosomal protein L17|nr:50S ribosomal protein L17 [bacterium]